MSEPMFEPAREIAPFLGFAALLRHASFAVAPEQTMAWLAAIELLGPKGIGDIRTRHRLSVSENSTRCSMRIFSVRWRQPCKRNPGKTRRRRPPTIRREGSSRFTAMTCMNPALRRPARSGCRRAASSPAMREIRCGSSPAHCRRAHRAGKAIAGEGHAVDRASMRGACFATRCVTPANSCGCTEGGGGCANGASWC